MPKHKKKKERPKLTKEDKQARKDARKLATLLSAEEKARQMKRDRLLKELEFVHLNLKEMKKKWRDNMLKIKLPEFRKDIKVAYSVFDRTMTLKDFTISCLLKEIDYADYQHQLNLSGFCQSLELCLRVMGERLSEAHLAYESSVKDALKHHELINKTVETVINQFETRLNLAMFDRDQRLREIYNNDMAEHAAHTNDTINSFKINRDKRQLDLEKELEMLYSEMAEYLKKHLEKYREQSMAYELLRKEDFKGAQFIHNLAKNIEACLDKIDVLKKELSEREAHKKLAVVDLQHEFQFFNRSYCTLRNRFNESVEKDDAQLVYLTSESKKVQLKLEEIKIKGERILSLLAICRKHETQMEKILSFPMMTKFKDLSEESEISIFTQGEYKSNEQFDLSQTFSKKSFFTCVENEMSERWGEDQGFQIMKKLLKPWGYPGPISDNSIISDTIDFSCSFCKSGDSQSSERENSLKGPVLKDVKSGSQEEMETSNENLMKLKVPISHDLKKFWEKVGAMEISRAAVTEEHKHLIRENLFLKDKLRQYLSYLPFQREVCDPTGGYPLAKRVLITSPRDIRNCLCLEYCICKSVHK